MTTEPEVLPPESTAVAVREPLPSPAPASLPAQPATVTPAQAKVEAIAQLTMSAYQKASQLNLTDAEIAALTADFPDEAFKPGAAGKDHLLYIEHAFLRDRLNQVFRPGQWAIVPRSRWAEEFKTATRKDATRVYVEAMLCIRGCFAAESIGEMEYFPHNASQNYGDAVEGAKSAALRRCCKELGVGLQAWKKDWCEGWWARKRGYKPSERSGGCQDTTPAGKTPNSPNLTTGKGTPELPAAGPNHLKRMIALLEPVRDHATEWMRRISWLMPNEVLEDLPKQHWPVSKSDMDAIMAAVQDFVDGLPAQKPGQQIEVPRSTKPEATETEESWRSFPMPFGRHAGVKLADLDKKYLFGLWANYEVETEYNGKPKKQETIERDQAFRDALDAAGEYYGFTLPEDKQ